MNDMELTPDGIRKTIRALGKWFHNLDLNGVQTAPDHFLGDYPNIKWRLFAHAIPHDLRGRTVLDVGCNAGFYSIEMKRRGADRVVGIDADEGYLDQARFATKVCGVDVELHNLSVYDVGKLGEKFDIVLFLGVMYHLRHPLLALDLLHEHVTRDLLVFQSMLRGSPEVEPVPEDAPFTETELFDRAGFPKLHFIENRYAGDPTNWWVPNRSAIQGMLRSAGYQIISHPEQEVFVCRHAELTDDEPRSVYPARRRFP